MKKLSREYVKNRGLDLYEDKVFIRHLVKEAQKIDPEIGGVFFGETKTLVFWWRRVIIYKVLLDEYNTEKIAIKQHIKNIATTLRMLKANLIPIKPLQEQNVDFNKYKTGKIV